MTLPVQNVLAARGIAPSAQHLEKIENKWAELEDIKPDHTTIGLNDADIALRNIPGSDHNG